MELHVEHSIPGRPRMRFSANLLNLKEIRQSSIHFRNYVGLYTTAELIPLSITSVINRVFLEFQVEGVAWRCFMARIKINFFLSSSLVVCNVLIGFLQRQKILINTFMAFCCSINIQIKKW